MTLSRSQLERWERAMRELQDEEEVRGALVAAWPHLESDGRARFIRDRLGRDRAPADPVPTIGRGPALDRFMGVPGA